MTSSNTPSNRDPFSRFGQLALKLDHDFSELERLSDQIGRLELESESGFERSLKLLPHFAQLGQDITEGIQSFAKAIEELRIRSESAANLVAEKASLIQARKAEEDGLKERLGKLASRVQETSAGLSAFRTEEKNQVPEQVGFLDARLSEFTEEVQAIRDQARRSRLKRIERNAESLYGTLQAARQKLSQVSPTLH